jgi:hypothetical protein
MKYLSYLIYIATFEMMVWYGTWYTVFILDKSIWWFLFALFLSSSAYRPEKWIHGHKEES